MCTTVGADEWALHGVVFELKVHGVDPMRPSVCRDDLPEIDATDTRIRNIAVDRPDGVS